MNKYFVRHTYLTFAWGTCMFWLSSHCLETLHRVLVRLGWQLRIQTRTGGMDEGWQLYYEWYYL